MPMLGILSVSIHSSNDHLSSARPGSIWTENKLRFPDSYVSDWQTTAFFCKKSVVGNGLREFDESLSYHMFI
ncbi:hypothetical protein CY34DRAFT_811262 [Suillus luteus UH-Slu-Lm8-n1]|uniref:Uncharacterized protein n=1 Tax=Suillus luteus UH-Slu-Lm8-n1 TaxID=930992 RepID=A0A0D0AEA1_9AGAM|nr:hypothetical protein CY34DRAFT_811262 [Suillus luteus UH-Slu-Lm8-n1]